MSLQPGREARIDLDAIEHNTRLLRERAGTAHAMAVVKANGYGHGAVESARAALRGGADHLGVVDLVEALELRAAGITSPVLAWIHDPEPDFAAAIAAGVELGLGTAGMLEAAAAAGAPSVQLKLDTGLGRNGVPEAEWPALFARAAAIERAGGPRIRGLFSHLAGAGEHEDRAQLAAFERALGLAEEAGLRPELRHLAATAGALFLPEARFDLVRLGIGLYGHSPVEHVSGAELGLRPAMTLSAPVVAVKRVPAGHGVSYGFTHRTERESTLALVPLGYADGVPRQASGRGPVRIGGRTFTVAGRVAMDQIVVDVGEHPVSVGDRAVLFGDPALGDPGARDWADAAGTIDYEIVTRIGHRVPRRYGGGA